MALPPRRRPASATIALALVLGAGGATGCDEARAPLDRSLDRVAGLDLEQPLPEPEQALRPEALRGRVPESAHVVDYAIEARLDEQRHEIAGSLRMAWTNPTAHAVDRLPFHLYMNAFRAEDTAWMRTARGSHRGEAFARDRWGFVDVRSVELLARSSAGTSVALEQAPAAGEALAYAEDADPSTMTVQLGERAPVAPGETVVVEVEFLTRLPRVFARTGYYGDFHMAGQWFPKIGVLEADGTWQAHTFSLFSEFYADFGDYEVALDLPSDFVVGATGIRVGEEDLGGGRKRVEYRAEMVHDFAWAADPDFVETWAEYEGIRIRQLIQPEHLDSAGAHLAAQLIAFESMEPRFGPYPWSTLTIVHPPAGAEGAGGMEYPTFYTTQDVERSKWIHPAVFTERWSGTYTSVHEFGHQYFQGLFASNEHAQPWLDEGMNSASNVLVYWDAHGEDPAMFRAFGHPLTTKDITAISLIQRGAVDPIDQPADRWDPLAGTYGAVTYQKTAAAMLTLRELVGREPWDEAMARYSERARFGHPDGALLEDTLVEVIGGDDGRVEVGRDLDDAPVFLDVREFLDQALRQASVIDFRVLEVSNRRRLGRAGWHRLAATAAGGEDSEREAQVRAVSEAVASAFGHEPPADVGAEGPLGPLRATASTSAWTSTIAQLRDDEIEGNVLIHRASPFCVPVQIAVEFADGETRVFTWDGQAPKARFDFPGRRVVRVRLDPQRALVLEPHRLDNGMWAEPGGKAEVEGPAAELSRDSALSRWFGDLSEALSLASLGGLGI